MKSSQVFDVCHKRYRGLRGWLKEATGEVHAVNLDMPSAAYQWRPDRSRACEYVADFERIGRRALRRPEWRGRLLVSRGETCGWVRILAHWFVSTKSLFRKLALKPLCEKALNVRTRVFSERGRATAESKEGPL
jgi:hypothetical protein